MYADEFHNINQLIGDRATGMGGAYTAVSDDASGLFYNPAGIVYVTDKNFSASVNAFFRRPKNLRALSAGSRSSENPMRYWPIFLALLNLLEN